MIDRQELLAALDTAGARPESRSFTQQEILAWREELADTILGLDTTVPKPVTDTGTMLYVAGSEGEDE